MIEWVKINDGRSGFEAANTSSRIVGPLFSSKIGISELKAIIPISPEFYPGGLEEPGPCERWYGYVNNLPFTIKSYFGEDNLTLVFALIIQSTQEKYLWSHAEKFIELPPPILRRVKWIHGHQAGAKKSLCFQDEYGIVCEFYRAADEIEATELLKFLRTIGAEDSYYIADSEDWNSTWIAIRSEQGSVGRIAGRYTSREATERVARSMSLNDAALYRVEEEREDGKKGLAFVAGKIVGG